MCTYQLLPLNPEQKSRFSRRCVQFLVFFKGSANVCTKSIINDALLLIKNLESPDEVNMKEIPGVRFKRGKIKKEEGKNRKERETEALTDSQYRGAFEFFL